MTISVNNPYPATRAAFGIISRKLLNIAILKIGIISLVRLLNKGDTFSMHICNGQGKQKLREEAGWSHPAPRLPILEINMDVPAIIY